MLQRSGTRQDLRCAFLKQALDAAPLGTNVVEAQLRRAGAGDDHQIDACGQKVGAQAETLPAEALDAVASHRAADGA
jgi:hypothetical protein